MAFHKRSDFLKLCGGMESRKLSIYIGRGKVFPMAQLLDGEMCFDDAIPENAAFIRKEATKQKSKAEAVVPDPPKKVKAKADPKRVEPVKKAQKEYTDPDNDPDEQRRRQFEIDFDQAQQKKALDLEKTQIEIRIARIREEKMRGELVPVQMIKNLFSQHSSSIHTEFKDFIEQFLNVVSKRKAFSSQEVADIRGEMLAALNESIDKAVDKSKRDIVGIAKEFSKTRDVGQHD